MKMNKLWALLISFCCLFFISCNQQNNAKTIRFVTAAQYPPFEYYVHGELTGFDIELAQKIAKELGKKAVFENKAFNEVLPAIALGQSDVAIATISITKERSKKLAFSIPYFFEGMSAIYSHNKPVTKTEQLRGKKIGVQLGSLMESWSHESFPDNEIMVFTTNDQAVEALKKGQIEVVLMDETQGLNFSKKHKELAHSLILKDDSGYGLVLKKGSPLLLEINQALESLKEKGEIQKLEDKWLVNRS